MLGSRSVLVANTDEVDSQFETGDALRRGIPLAVKEGDGILFGKYCGTEIKIDGEDFLIMKEEEVLGIITGAAKKQTLGAKR